jgi:hypothetical protein
MTTCDNDNGVHFADQTAKAKVTGPYPRLESFLTDAGVLRRLWVPFSSSGLDIESCAEGFGGFGACVSVRAS